MPKGFKPYDSDSDIEEVAPEVIIELIGKISHMNGFPISYNTCEHSYYLLVGNSVFAPCAVVAAYYVAIPLHLEYTVKYVSALCVLIKRNVVLLQSARRTLDYHNVTVLAQKRHHTRSNVGTDYPAVF